MGAGAGDSVAGMGDSDAGVPRSDRPRLPPPRRVGANRRVCFLTVEFVGVSDMSDINLSKDGGFRSFKRERKKIGKKTEAYQPQHGTPSEFQ